MNNKKNWRSGMAIAEIMAMVVVVIPVTIFIITLLFDYWAVMRMDNQVKLIAHRGVMYINNAVDASSADKVIGSMSEAEVKTMVSLCPPSNPSLNFVRTGNSNEGEIVLEAKMVYSELNHLEPKTVSTIIKSYSYNDQNGSFVLECKEK